MIHLYYITAIAISVGITHIISHTRGYGKGFKDGSIGDFVRWGKKK